MAHRALLRRGSVLLCVAAVLAVVGLVAGGVAAKTTLTVYTAIEADDLKKYAARFNEDNPDIEIKWVRDSTGIVTAKLLAEKANPQADVIWGLAATSLLVLKPEVMLLPYAPKGLDKLDPQFRDKDNPPPRRPSRPRTAGCPCRGTAGRACRGAEEEPAKARHVEGPDQARLQ